MKKILPNHKLKRSVQSIKEKITTLKVTFIHKIQREKIMSYLFHTKEMPYVCWSPIYVKTPTVNFYSLGKNHLLNYVNHGITNYKVYRKRYFNSSTIYHLNYFNNDLERTSFW